jgi:hypothetical protein
MWRAMRGACFRVNEAEQDPLSGWLTAGEEPLEAEAAARLGMAVVRRRVEEYFEHHLVERWIPKLLARLAEEARRPTVEKSAPRAADAPSVRGPWRSCPPCCLQIARGRCWTWSRAGRQRRQR